jgi:hypothetical protein
MMNKFLLAVQVDCRIILELGPYSLGAWHVTLDTH